MTCDGDPPRNSVWPSGLACATALAPIAVPAPGRFSTTTGRPSVSLIPSATVRASRSAGPPAAYGLINVMVRSGKDWATACPANGDIAKRNAATRRFMHPSRSIAGPLAFSQGHTTIQSSAARSGNGIGMPKTRTNTLLPTTLVGSYPQPDWLIDRPRLAGIVPPRAHARELWHVDPSHLEQAQDDATILAIRDQERAGIDIVTDGEIRRESYSNRFATALDGMDGDNPAQIPSRTAGKVQIVPRVVSKIRRRQPVQVRDVEFLRANTDRPIRVTIPGPFTMTQQLFDEYYKDEAAVAVDCAIALNEEIRDMFAAGADVVQLDEPFLQAYPDKARAFGVAAINRAV